MIRALWRALVARRRLHRHQAQHGDLLDVSRETLASGRLVCGQPLRAEGYYCTEPARHAGPHRHHLTGTLELHTATASEHPDDPEGAPLLEAPERRGTWRPPPPPPYQPGRYGGG